ncbi:hypothetical protein AVEN_87974-1 [Araneus ventricosus]|uniref:Uncharacterized protein n=1 Tax=Araneus ventricosus TaxID=182803 RepID=A0A4Y2NBB6_ARAVE|nr:hypothetical protein AVEN_87974-1 [Araneus ventricosus]
MKDFSEDRPEMPPIGLEALAVCQALDRDVEYLFDELLFTEQYQKITNTSDDYCQKGVIQLLRKARPSKRPRYEKTITSFGREKEINAPRSKGETLTTQQGYQNSSDVLFTSKRISDPDPQKERLDPIPTKRNESAELDS